IATRVARERLTLLKLKTNFLPGDLSPMHAAMLREKINLKSDKDLERDFLAILSETPHGSVDQKYALLELSEFFATIVSYQDHDYQERLLSSAREIIYGSPLDRYNQINDEDDVP